MMRPLTSHQRALRSTTSSLAHRLAQKQQRTPVSPAEVLLARWRDLVARMGPEEQKFHTPKTARERERYLGHGCYVAGETTNGHLRMRVLVSGPDDGWIDLYADHCVIKVDRRWVPEEKLQRVFGEIYAIFDKLKKENPQFKAELVRDPSNMKTMTHVPNVVSPVPPSREGAWRVCQGSDW